MRVWLLLVAGALSGCNCGGTGLCTSDAQCDATGQGYSTCDLKQGICLCNDDRACGPNEHCNALGRCQAVAGCSTNDDCATDLFCDITSSNCLSVQECNPQTGQTCCTLDDQCPFRNICDALTLTCVPGCRDNGDCLIGEGCVGAGFGRLGQCGTACTADNLCPAGDLCNLARGVCEVDTRGPYCLSCAGGVGSHDCRTPGNYCLTDDVNGGEFCGVDCFSGEACPNAYSCQDVIIVPPAAPFCTFPESCVIPGGQPTGNCSRNTASTCAQSEDCPEGPPFGDCRQRVGRSGSCTAPNSNVDCAVDADCPGGTCVLINCVGSEAGGFGVCTCTRDSDCPTDSCVNADLSDPNNPVEGHCELSGHRCFTDPDCDVIACTQGGCLIGSNCAPSNDRSCRDLLPVTP